MIVNGFLIFLAAVFEAYVFADFPILGVVPPLTLLTIIWFGRRSQRPEDILIYGVLAGCLIDVLRPAYSPWFLVLGALSGLLVLLWFQVINLSDRLTQRFGESVVVPLSIILVTYNVVMLTVYGLQSGALAFLASIAVQFGLLMFISGIAWVIEGRIAQA